jgi:hypothetical protein
MSTIHPTKIPTDTICRVVRRVRGKTADGQVDPGGVPIQSRGDWQRITWWTVRRGLITRRSEAQILPATQKGRSGLVREAGPSAVRGPNPTDRRTVNSPASFKAQSQCARRTTGVWEQDGRDGAPRSSRRAGIARSSRRLGVGGLEGACMLVGEARKRPSCSSTRAGR